MFKLKKSRTFTWPVTVAVPENGRHVKSSFNAEFRVLDREQMVAETRAFSDPELSPEEQARRLSDFLGRVLVTVEGVVYENERGEPETDSRAICDALIADSMTAGPLFEAFVAGMNGATRKN